MTLRPLCAAAFAVAIVGCGPSAEEQADLSIVSAIEGLARSEAKDVTGREALVKRLQEVPKGSAEGEAARGACAVYYQAQIDLRKTLDRVDALAPKDKPDVEPTLEILALLAEAEELQKHATATLEPCTEATGTLRVKKP